MSGKPQFDEAKVIAAAVRVFWTHGYAAASLSELTEATGLARSSLYQRFKDKDGLFVEAMKAYSDRVVHRMAAATGITARMRLASLFRDFLPDAAGPERPPGCLVARSCAEHADLTEAGRAAALVGISRQREVISGILQDGYNRGEISHCADLDALAWHFLGVFQAVLNFPQADANADVLNRMINVAMLPWPDIERGSN